MNKHNNDKTSFWGRPIKDQNGSLIGYKDEFGDVRTPKQITQEISGCLIFLIAALALVGGCTARVYEEVKERHEKKQGKPVSERVDMIHLNNLQTVER